MRFEFEKKGKLLTVVIENAQLTIEVDGERVPAKPINSVKHNAWVYMIEHTSNKKFFISLGVKAGLLKIGHESAEIAEAELSRQQKDKDLKEQEEHKLACAQAKRVLIKKFREFDGYKFFDALILSYVIPINHEWKENRIKNSSTWYKEIVEKMLWESAGDHRYYHLTDIDVTTSPTAQEIAIQEGELMISENEVFLVSEETLGIILSEVEKEKKEAEEVKMAADAMKEMVLAEKFAEAKRTGERVLIRTWTENCNDPRKECSLDAVSEWAMPDNSKEITRSHSY